MAVKMHSRSFRYTEAVANVLETYGGEGLSLNERFELLILDCYNKMPNLTVQLRMAEERRDALYAECRELMQHITDLRAFGRQVDELMTTCQFARLRVERALERFGMDDV